MRIRCSDWNHTSSVYGNRIPEDPAYHRIREMEIRTTERSLFYQDQDFQAAAREHQRRPREPSMALFWKLLRGTSRLWHRKFRHPIVVMTDTWKMLKGLLLKKWRTRAQEVLHNDRQHMIAEQQELVQAADTHMQVGRIGGRPDINSREVAWETCCAGTDETKMPCFGRRRSRIKRSCTGRSAWRVSSKSMVSLERVWGRCDNSWETVVYRRNIL